MYMMKVLKKVVPLIVKLMRRTCKGAADTFTGFCSNQPRKSVRLTLQRGVAHRLTLAHSPSIIAHSLSPTMLKCDFMSHGLCHTMSDSKGLFCLFSLFYVSWALT